MIPTMWHDQPSYGHASYDPVWAACAEAGLVVHTHSGEADTPAYNENMAQFMLEVAFWTHRALWQLLLAGKFDQFPNLKYAPVECGSWWVGDLLFKTDVMFGGTNWKVKKMASQTKGLDPAPAVGVLRHERVHRRVGHEQARDPPPLRQRPRRARCGAPTTRIPRARGPTPSSGSTTDFRAVPVEETRLLLGLNAVRCYDLDLDALDGHRGRRSGRRPSSSTRTSTCARRPNAIREARFWFDDYGIEWKG